MVPFSPFVQFLCPSPQSRMKRDRQSSSRNCRGSRSFRPCSSREFPSEIGWRVPSLVLAVHQSRESRVFTPFAFGRMRKQRFCGSTGAPTPALPSTCALFGALVALFSIAILSFQQLAHSLCKTAGWHTCGTSSRSYRLPANPILFTLCFHGVTNCFFRNSFVFRIICVAPGGGGCKPFLFALQG